METLTEFQWMERYIRDPEGEMDGFWDSGVPIWVDWRDYDEWIIQSVCERLPEGARFHWTAACPGARTSCWGGTGFWRQSPMPRSAWTGTLR